MTSCIMKKTMDQNILIIDKLKCTIRDTERNTNEKRRYN